MGDELARLWAHDIWVRLGVTVAAALLLAALLRSVAYAVLRRLTRRHPVAAGMIDRASAPMEWLMPLLMLVIALRMLPEAATLGPVVVLRRLLTIALVAVATWLAVRCIGALEEAALRRYPVDVADNLRARRVATQVRVLGRTADILAILLGAAAILLTIPGVRQLGASLLASAGVAGLVLGLAAKPVLSNVVAGLQIAVTQPIRLDDVVIIQGEWGRIEEITGSYVVVRIWDERRLVVPLNWFIENPFQNWTRTSAQLIGTVFLWLDYRVPLAPLRGELERLCRDAPEWDGRVCVLQVTDANERAMQLRALVSSVDSGRNWDLRCRVREGLIAYVQANHPDALPRWRGEMEPAAGRPAPPGGPILPAQPGTQQSPSPEDGGPRR
ncbi:mechanosensitive ion channel family protein [Fulvimonas sp. R45]|uniref:mechanosensitive ion channel family protein n=1 Tax=Fulvimonas sp. R45 TaxID=3045937 RepID=UPI00265F36D9|nr:mechanosensitive ion channel family protein [Fulvimonas sp. R45]MDO1529869.1 mechanosensitive ion channel family protein [Fulvimonas sp. R45]